MMTTDSFYHAFNPQDLLFICLHSTHSISFSKMCNICFVHPKYSRVLILNCQLSIRTLEYLVHPIFSSFGFWYFGHFSCVIFFPVFRPAHLALQNVNKDYIFSNFCNLFIKSHHKPKTKRMNETYMLSYSNSRPLPDLLSFQDLVCY